MGAKGQGWPGGRRTEQNDAKAKTTGLTDAGEIPGSFFCILLYLFPTKTGGTGRKRNAMINVPIS